MALNCFPSPHKHWLYNDNDTRVTGTEEKPLHSMNSDKWEVTVNFWHLNRVIGTKIVYCQLEIGRNLTVYWGFNGTEFRPSSRFHCLHPGKIKGRFICPRLKFLTNQYRDLRKFCPCPFNVIHVNLMKKVSF
jgi:hypothetical protein